MELNSSHNISYHSTLIENEVDEFGGWNKDIASNDGVPSKLLRVAKTVETYWKVVANFVDANKQLLALNNLAQTFKDNNLPTDDVSLKG